SVSNQSAISLNPSSRACFAIPGYISVYSCVSPAIAALRLSFVSPIGKPVAGSPTTSRYSRWPCACPVSPSAVERKTADTSLKPWTSALAAKKRYRRFACDSPANASFRFFSVLLPLRFMPLFSCLRLGLTGGGTVSLRCRRVNYIDRYNHVCITCSVYVRDQDTRLRAGACRARGAGRAPRAWRSAARRGAQDLRAGRGVDAALPGLAQGRPAAGRNPAETKWPARSRAIQRHRTAAGPRQHAEPRLIAKILLQYRNDRDREPLQYAGVHCLK